MIVTETGMFAWLDSKIFKSLRGHDIAYAKLIHSKGQARMIVWLEKKLIDVQESL